MSRANLAVIGYGNMAKAIIKGALDFGTTLSVPRVFDIFSVVIPAAIEI